MKLFDLFLGKQNTYTDSFLGTIVSQRIKKATSTKLYSWYGSYTLPNTTLETSIILEGTDKQPNTIQLEALKHILQNTTDLYAKVAEAVKRENHAKPEEEKLIVSNWEAEYYIAYIAPTDGVQPNFDICIDPIDEHKKEAKYITFYYINNEVVELEFDNYH